MRKSYFWFFVSLLILATLPTVAADRGMWVPPEVDVYGPGQKAIIAWNGEQEILILATDVYSLPQPLQGLFGLQAVVFENATENGWTLKLLDIYKWYYDAPSAQVTGTFTLTTFDEILLHENIWVLAPQRLEDLGDNLVLKRLDEHPIPENSWVNMAFASETGYSGVGGTLSEVFSPEWWAIYVGSATSIEREKVWVLARSDGPLDAPWYLAPLCEHPLPKENHRVLEFLPLPSLPEVEKGSFESFTQIQHLIMEHAPEWLAPTLGPEGREGVEIVFHERIGAHDVTIVKVTNDSEFITWAENFLDNQNVEHEAPPERLGAIVDTYLQRGMSYFVFDLIEVGLSPHSIDPLVYRFQSDFLYYPLEISSLVSGTTNITLFTLTHDGVGEHYAPEDSIEVRLGFEVSENELQLIDSEIAELFHGSARLTVLTYNGALEILKGDLMLSAKVDQLLAAAWAAAVILILLGIFAIIYKLSPYYKTGPPG